MGIIKRIIIAIFLIAFAGVGAYHYEIHMKKIEVPRKLEFKKGESVRTLLDEIGLEDDFFLKVYFRLSGVSSEIKAGTYKLNRTYTVSEFFQVLKEGRFEMIRITIPEGYTVKQIKKLLVSKKMLTNAEFDKALKEIEFPYLTPNNNFEGYLYPETYYFAKGSNPKVIIKTILDEFLKEYPVRKYGDSEEAKKDFYQKLILASIVEREAILNKEKPIIASVFYNRLKKGMRLESDATVNYIFNYEKRRIYYKDLKIDSPYNTYRHHGLPPAPIGNPGKIAIEASLNPAKTEYLFFVAKYDGTLAHHFTKTYKEHMNYQKNNKHKPK